MSADQIKLLLVHKSWNNSTLIQIFNLLKRRSFEIEFNLKVIKIFILVIKLNKQEDQE